MDVHVHIHHRSRHDDEIYITLAGVDHKICDYTETSAESLNLASQLHAIVTTFTLLICSVGHSFSIFSMFLNTVVPVLFVSLNMTFQ